MMKRLYAFYHGDTGSVPGDFMYDPWWTEWYWSTAFSKFLQFSSANHHSILFRTHLSQPPQVHGSSGPVTE
jgi:hypothetical protein